MTAVLKDLDIGHFLYRMYDAAGELMYIGQTKRPYTRYHYNHWWWDRAKVTRIDWEPVGSLEDALRLEAAAIRAERPRYTTQHNLQRSVKRKSGGEAA